MTFSIQSNSPGQCSPIPCLDDWEESCFIHVWSSTAVKTNKQFYKVNENFIKKKALKHIRVSLRVKSGD